jgi:hypothetical protein
MVNLSLISDFSNFDIVYRLLGLVGLYLISIIDLSKWINCKPISKDGSMIATMSTGPSIKIRVVIFRNADNQ